MNDRAQPRFEQTRLPTEEALHAPGFIYTSPELYQLEKERIFMRDWLCLGREEEIPNKGDYIATRVLDEPVLLIRGENGEINAMSNVCAHRGVEVATGSGNKRAFTCPFHGWTYDLQGKLVGAPHMREATGFNAAACRLPPIRVARWKGWIFINFDDQAPPFATFVQQFEKDFGYLPQEQCRLGVKTVSMEVNCNWKLIVENLIDFYHLNVVHRGTNGRSFTKEAFKFDPRPNGSYVVFYNSGPSTPSQEPVFGKAPWMEDRPNDFSTAGLLPPNFTFFARVDTIHPYVTWPLGLDKSQVTVYTLLPEVYFDAPHFAERVEAYRTFQKQVLNEDSAMLASLQNGLASKRFAPGRMATLERGAHHVLKAYLDRMFPAE
jgi:choline monooxygenase